MPGHYKVKETLACGFSPCCPECGNRGRRVALVEADAVPVRTYVEMLWTYEARWPGSRVDSSQGRHRIIGPRSCNCEEKDA